MKREMKMTVGRSGYFHETLLGDEDEAVTGRATVTLSEFLMNHLDAVDVLLTSVSTKSGRLTKGDVYGRHDSGASLTALKVKYPERTYRIAKYRRNGYSAWDGTVAYIERVRS